MSAVTHYLELKRKILDRRLLEFGIQPYLAYILAPLLFFFISFLLFYKTEYAVYIYSTLALSYLFQFSNKKKSDFLELYFKKEAFKKIRIVENALVVLPFVIFLLFKMHFMWALGLTLFALGLSFFKGKANSNLHLPTPFGKYPYEFATGIRKLFPFYLGILFLLLMAVSVGNYNLGLFALAMVPFLCMNFYGELENPFYVWIYNKSPMDFLKHKALVASFYLCLLSLPVFIVLAFVFPEMIKISIAVFVLSFGYLASYIVFKYVRFPQQQNFAQIVLLTLSYLFPPLLIVTVGYYIGKAKLNLQEYLK